jgi:tetratricopeptide (TPR) repeat protein
MKALNLRARIALGVVVAATGLGAGFGAWRNCSRGTPVLATTFGDLRVNHAEVQVRGREVRGQARLVRGDEIKTGPTGRAQVRLDDGTQVVVDGDTTLVLDGTVLRLVKGRLFVQAGAAAQTQVAFAGAKTTVVTSAAAFEANSETSGKVYCARGELVVLRGDAPVRVPSGETARLSQLKGKAEVKVAPETAFDDWTGGLATPWSGDRGPRSAIPELWAGPGTPGTVDPGTPMVVRSATVQVNVEGELSTTRMKASYFNGGDQSAQADVRMALPSGALISRIARLDEGAPTPIDAVLGPGKTATGGASSSRLEWAGDGWVRGTLTDIPAGKTTDLIVEYTEWLARRDGRATYRFPMASELEAPMVGGLSIGLTGDDGLQLLSTSVHAAATSAHAVELRQADTRPTGDFVVELDAKVQRPGEARAYIASGDPGEDPYVWIRTEAPEANEPGVTLAVVVDSSMSVGPALLETERVVVNALLDALGPKDAIVVLAADQSVRPVGPSQSTQLTPEVRAEVRKKLGALRAGGASNVGLALETAADLLDRQAKERGGTGMVVYVGDGRATVGEVTARDLRNRLARRPSGVPRIATVAVGAGADRTLLAELAQGSGPIYEALDRQEAARAGGALVSDALANVVRGVSLDLGPAVDRVYPREPRTWLAGSTFSVSGRLRGALPDKVTLRYRRGNELVEESRPLTRVPLPAGADLGRRWASARVEEIAMRGEGIEGAVMLASKHQLLTPWTGFYWGGSTTAAPWDDRLMGLNLEGDMAFAGLVAPPAPQPSLLLEPPAVFAGEDTLEAAIETAARHAIVDALPALVACRDARSATNPSVDSRLSVSLRVDAQGRATQVNVTSSGGRGHDTVLERCSRGVIASIAFFASGTAVSVTHTLELPELGSTQRSVCSATSKVPLAVKRGIWRARKQRRELDYRTAKHQCELPHWNDTRTFLQTLMANESIDQASTLAANLAAMGDADAAKFVRQELLRRPEISALQFDALRRLFVGDEPRIDRSLDTAYRAAKSDADRMSVLRRFLRVAPHSPLGRRLWFTLLEATGQKAALVEAIFEVRTDPFSDAGLLAAGASTLLRLGDADEGRRAFGELVERAPRDPWTLAYTGDRLRSEGLYEDALASYQRLDVAAPDDPGVALRLALAQAGTGRLDLAVRLLDRAGQTGGRADDGRTGELSSILAATLLADARTTKPAPAPETDALLVRRFAETPLPDVASLVLVRTPLGDDPVEVEVARRETDKDLLPADLDAAAMGLSAIRIERGGGTARIHLRRKAAIAGARPLRGTVAALVMGPDRSKARVVTREVEIDAKGAELRWDGEAFR